MRKIRNIEDVGLMDKKIKFQRYAGVSDGGAGKRAAWSDLPAKPTRWANVSNTSGNRLVQVAGRMMYIKGVIFKIQYDEEIYTVPTGSLRIIYPATGTRRRAYEIMGMDPVLNESYFLEIFCNGNEVEAV